MYIDHIERGSKFNNSQFIIFKCFRFPKTNVSLSSHVMWSLWLLAGSKLTSHEFTLHFVEFTFAGSKLQVNFYFNYYVLCQDNGNWVTISSSGILFSTKNYNYYYIILLLRNKTSTAIKVISSSVRPILPSSKSFFCLHCDSAGNISGIRLIWIYGNYWQIACIEVFLKIV